jgi:hypothetical protein
VSTATASSFLNTAGHDGRVTINERIGAGQGSHDRAVFAEDGPRLSAGHGHHDTLNNAHQFPANVIARQ